MVADALFFWSRRFDSQPTVRLDVSGTGQETVTIPFASNVDYYTAGTIAQATLLAAFETGLETHSSGANFTVNSVTTSPTDIPRVQISGTLNWRILWADAGTTIDPEILGWTAVDMPSLVSVATSPNIAGQVWHPRRPTSGDSLDRRRVVGGITRSITGPIRVSNFGQPRKERDITVEKFANTYALQEAALTDEPQNTFEEMWLEGAALGRPFRIWRPGELFSASVEYNARALREPLQRDPQYEVLWNVDLPMVRTS